MAQFAELVFAYIDELSAASVAGHTDELSTSGRVRERYLERLGQHLLAGASADVLAASAVTGAGLDILSERGALALDRPELEAVTGVLVREGPSRNAFVVAGLLEPWPRDGRPILAGMGCTLTGPATAAAWIEAYARVAVLPPLRLFAATGIGLEAHAQNSLLALEDGLPSRLVVRDLTLGIQAGQALGVIGPGSLVEDSQVEKVQHPTGGVVGALLVREGARVKAGDVLIRLDATRARASLATIRKALDEFVVRRARVEAQFQIGERTVVSYLTRPLTDQIAKAWRER
jgi:hypothetical protein